jgi:hypothetical protein
MRSLKQTQGLVSDCFSDSELGPLPLSRLTPSARPAETFSNWVIIREKFSQTWENYFLKSKNIYD